MRIGMRVAPPVLVVWVRASGGRELIAKYMWVDGEVRARRKREECLHVRA